MRQHFHRCRHLRVFFLEASDLGHRRRGAGPVLDELCDAKRMTPCVGLEDCDVLSPAAKRDLLVARATEIRRKEGKNTVLSGVRRERGRQLRDLREKFLLERNGIVSENRRVESELAGAVAVVGSDEAIDASELSANGISIRIDKVLVQNRAQRLDELNRALAAMACPDYGTCGLCRREIPINRLSGSPHTPLCALCALCAGEVES